MKKVRKSAFMLMASVMSLSALLAACSGGNAEKPAAETPGSGTTAEQPAVDKPKEKVELEFWTHWGSTTRRPIIEKIVSDFNGSQDWITVKHVFLPYGEGWTKALAQIAAGNPPDVIIHEIAKVAQRADKNQVENLSPFLAKDDISGRFHEYLYEAMKYNGDVYALPFNTDTRFLFYNKKMFAEAGLDPEKPPTTWAEMEEYAKKLDVIGADGKIERLGYHPLLAGGHEMFMLNAGGGKAWVSADAKEVNINTPEHVEALKWLLSWNERLGQQNVETFKATFGSKTNEPLIAGKLAMKVENGTFWTQIRDFAANRDDFGVAPMPEFKPGSGHHSFSGGFTIEIPKGAKHPEASWEFLKFMTDYDAQKYWAQFNFDNVANKEVALDEDLLKDPVYAFSVQNLEVSNLTPAPVSAPDFQTLLNPEIEAAIQGQQSPEDALAKAQKAVEDLIAQNQ
ncbi:ABC transporter substrate-binding protein [Paenibacillus antri]|uniref:ABC transporter substrate-binding protein n=1 Tax=Paenibacillus antri TaxID=2582848 RepID=A0A5R9GCV2_9BACL|nr:ABC transporter substrate-binding protein [Paenibacillus antri]TLS52929.1 ABC transporter substrate-binding protein [Paenibacillus antri]